MAYFSGVKEEALPAELTDRICSYLDAEDLLRLSATNTFWRNAVNRDSVWKRLCVIYFKVNTSEKPLIERKCRVEPPFETVTNSSQKLSDICVWRIRFAQEIYVLNNWKHKRFHTENLPEDIPRLLRNSYFIYGNFAVFRTHAKNVIQIWKVTDDGFIKMEPIVFHDNEVINVHPLKNGFVIISSPFIYYYVLDEDGFQLKIRSLVTKALHPEIPLLTDPSQIDTSHFEEFKDNRLRYFREVVNERYFVVYDHIDEYISFIIWDLRNFTTFSYNLNQSIKDRSRRIYLGEGESSILYVHFGVRLVGSTIYILKIQNSRIDILNVHNTKRSSYDRMRIVGDSLAMNYDRETVFLAKDGTTRRIRCFVFYELINCRSFYVGISKQKHRRPQQVVSIDKKTLSVQNIREGFEMDVTGYLKPSSLDLVFFSYFDKEPVEPFYDSDCDYDTQELNDAYYEALCAENEEKIDLYDLRKSKIISWSKKEYNNITKGITNNNKIILSSWYEKNIFYFW